MPCRDDAYLAPPPGIDYDEKLPQSIQPNGNIAILRRVFIFDGKRPVVFKYGGGIGKRNAMFAEVGVSLVAILLVVH